jgi:hypothetical protein
LAVLASAEVHRDLVDSIVMQDYEVAMTSNRIIAALCRRVPKLYTHTQSFSEVLTNRSPVHTYFFKNQLLCTMLE